MGKNSNPAPEGQRPWKDVSVFAGGPGQKWTGPASIILIAVLIVGSLVILFMPRPQAPEAEISSAPSAEPGGEDGGEHVCPETAFDAQALDAPADLAWSAEVGTSWPESATVGPTKDIDGISRCFAHTPIGAALAAVNLTQSVRVADLDRAQQILEVQYVANEGRSVAAAGIAKIYADQPPATRQWGRAMGFKILAFSEDQARVLLVENWPQRGQYTGYSVTLHWVDGDWKIALETTGQPSADGEITVDPDGFTPWEAAR